MFDSHWRRAGLA